jgi:hypothetical protein
MQLRRMSTTRRGTVNNDERDLGSLPTAANVVPSPPHPFVALAAMMTQRTKMKERRHQELATKKQTPPLPLPLPPHEAQQLVEKTEATKRMIRVASMMKSDTHLLSSQIVPPVALAKFMLLVSKDTQHVIGMNDHHHGREMTAHLGVHHITIDEANKGKIAMYFTNQAPYDSAVAWVIATKSEELEKHIALGCPYPFCVAARSERELPPLVAAAATVPVAAVAAGGEGDGVLRGKQSPLPSPAESVEAEASPSVGTGVQITGGVVDSGGGGYSGGGGVRGYGETGSKDGEGGNIDEGSGGDGGGGGGGGDADWLVDPFSALNVSNSPPSSRASGKEEEEEESNGSDSFVLRIGGGGDGEGSDDEDSDWDHHHHGDVDNSPNANTNGSSRLTVGGDGDYYEVPNNDDDDGDVYSGSPSARGGRLSSGAHGAEAKERFSIGALGGSMDYNDIILNPLEGGINTPPMPRKLSSTAEGWLEIRSNEVSKTSEDGYLWEARWCRIKSGFVEYFSYRPSTVHGNSASAETAVIDLANGSQTAAFKAAVKAAGKAAGTAAAGKAVGQEEPRLRLDLLRVHRVSVSKMRRASEMSEAISPTQEVKKFDAGLVGAGKRGR